jgi:hypothetical protein
MFSISEVEGRWHLDRDGDSLGDFATYHEAVSALAAEAPEGEQSSGVLGDTWSSGEGICFAEPTGDGRDFTGCSWSWRDPGVSLLPLMFQDRTDMGHFGAELAGYIGSLSQADGTVQAEGHFYDSETGRAARDLLLEGRRFGVSVDPGAVEATWECLSEDEDGWCTEERIAFAAYEVIGLTMTPFPAFARASIGLAAAAQLAVAPEDHAFTDDNDDGRCDACLAEDEDGNCTQVCDLEEDEHESAGEAPEFPAAIAAAAHHLPIPSRPPRSFFFEPEPEFGDERLIEQEDGTLACPVTITDDGHVYGHAARWGQCHTGYLDHCVSPPVSPTSYRGFHVGAVRLDDGEDLPVGALTIGADHAPSYLGAQGARDHYAHTGLAWASVRCSNGTFGPWVSGVLRPTVTDELLTVVRASTLSGDWRGGDMIGVLAVNTPGFPIMREALVAAGTTITEERPRARFEGGEVVTLVAAGQVRRCPDCAARARALRNGGTSAPAALDARTAAMLSSLVRDAVESAVAPLVAQLDRVEVRTRHLRGPQADAIRARLTAHPARV